MARNPEVSYLGQTNHRGKPRLFGIRQRDRRSHLYTIGKTGTGKSTLLKNLIHQDILASRGLALFDPHGDLVQEVLALVPASRRSDLVYLDTPSGSWHFNPLSGVARENIPLAVAEIVEVFKKIWSEDWGPRLEHLLRNVLFALLEASGSNFGDIPRLLTDKKFREGVLSRIENQEVRDFWHFEYERYSPAFRAVVVAPLQNKLGAMLTDPRVREIITAKKSSFDLREVIDEGKILLVNLARGEIGEGPSALLGSLLVAHLGLAGLSRAGTPEEERRSFFCYLDEFQVFATKSLATMLAELRKFGIGMVLANQYLSQVESEIRDAVLGNVGTIISFRVSARDASFLAREFSPVFRADDLVGLPNYNIYLRLMIGGEVSRPFSAETFPRWFPEWS